MTDTDLIDWLERQFGCALVSDDAGRWAVVWDGHQTLPSNDRPTDIEATFFIEAAAWRDNVRDAILAAMDEAAGS